MFVYSVTFVLLYWVGDPSAQIVLGDLSARVLSDLSARVLSDISARVLSDLSAPESARGGDSLGDAAVLGDL